MSKNINGEWVLIGNSIYKKKPEGMFYIEAPIAKIFNTKEKKHTIRLNEDALKNAFLIESAPELLKTLKSMINGFNEEKDYKAMVEYAKTVIKKAERKNR